MRVADTVLMADAEARLDRQAATTALRWLRSMVDQQMFVRRADPHDGRRVFVELAPETSRALRSYFTEVGRLATVI